MGPIFLEQLCTISYFLERLFFMFFMFLVSLRFLMFLASSELLLCTVLYVNYHTSLIVCLYLSVTSFNNWCWTKYSWADQLFLESSLQAPKFFSSAWNFHVSFEPRGCNNFRNRPQASQFAIISLASSKFHRSNKWLLNRQNE